MRPRVTPPRYARKPFNAGKGGCLIYVVAGISFIIGLLYYMV